MLVVLSCLLFMLIAPHTLAADSSGSQGWSLLPEAGNQNPDSKVLPNYQIKPAKVNPLRIQSNRAPAPVSLQTDSQQPLFFELNNKRYDLNPGLQSQGQLDLTSVLGWQPLDQLVVALGLQTSIFERAQASTNFQPISNIQCESASVEPGLYHASNCHFTNSSLASSQPLTNFSSLGATWGSNDLASLQLEYFRQNTTAINTNLAASSAIPNLLTSGHDPLTDNRALLPSAYLGGNTQLDGFGLNMALGFNHDQMGKLRLGLQLSRINQVEYKNGFDAYTQTQLPLSAISPFHTAAVNIDWNRGAFSGGFQGYYREPLTLYNQENTDDLSGFDIYFSWRAPWNANLSIGTTSIIEPGISAAITEDNSDPFEMKYGRVPYVRYQQDL